MWFKNLRLYHLAGVQDLARAALESMLARRCLRPCGHFELISRGFLPPFNDEEWIFAADGHWLLALGIEQKLLPATVIRQQAQERARKIERAENRRVGRQESRRIAEQVAEELLPRALVQRRTTWLWIDPRRQRLLIDAGSDARADEAVEMLITTLEGIAPRLLTPHVAASAAMTEWLAAHAPPAGFSFADDLELKPGNRAKSAIRYVHHDIGGEEVRAHIAAGKRVTRLGLTWRERVSFVLAEPFQIKRLAFHDVLKEEAAQAVEGGAEPIAADFALMAGELAELIDDLLLALGGEQKTV